MLARDDDLLRSSRLGVAGCHLEYRQVCDVGLDRGGLVREDVVSADLAMVGLHLMADVEVGTRCVVMVYLYGKDDVQVLVDEDLEDEQGFAGLVQTWSLSVSGRAHIVAKKADRKSVV